ncbi:MAG: hypothetical protein ACYC43_10495, partial [Burkholderiales bacterium]
MPDGGEDDFIGTKHGVNVMSMQGLNFNSWSLGKKLSGMVFALVFLLFAGFVLGMGNSTYGLMKARAVNSMV